jgi:Transcriptional regulator/sugar kinase
MRLGVDLGGTKIEILALDTGGREILRERVATPRGSYGDTLKAIADLVLAAESKLGESGSLGLGIPGTLSPKTGLVKNANSTDLIGHALDKDLAVALKRPIRIENDANCFTLSEASDGAAKGEKVVFGIIAGTGVGGGVCINGNILTGNHKLAGEWGHNCLPWPSCEEMNAAPICYCGKRGCIETWCSGPAFMRLYEDRSGDKKAIPDIIEAARIGEITALRETELFYDRFARAISGIVNILDPDVIVLGGGLSNIDALYTELPPRVERYAFTPETPIRIVKNNHGDSSGVRGAAWLWREEEVLSALPK